jgi:hypothetical protein
MKAKEVNCVMCDKIIGHEIYEGAISSPLGSIPCYRQKLDYRKAAHVCFDGRDKDGKRIHGNICKTCARQYWTEGKSYFVRFKHNGKDTSVFGDNGSRFYTKQNALDCLARLEKKNPNTRYWIDEQKL